MIKSVVSRDDNIYECFPAITQCKDGVLVCAYRECMGHACYPFSRIVIRRSTDGGLSWYPKQIIDEGVVDADTFNEIKVWLSDNEIAEYQETLKRIKNNSDIFNSYNSSAILCLSDGELLLAIDIYKKDIATGQCKWIIAFYRSFDSGLTWEKPKFLNLNGGLVPSLNELRDGRIMLCLTKETVGDYGDCDEEQYVLFSEDKGYTWSEPVGIPSVDGLNLCEGSFVELDDGTIYGILRDDNIGKGYKKLNNGTLKLYSNVGCGYKVLSKDGGKTWIGPFTTELIGLQGRPKAGILKSGELCITYRACLPNSMLAMHVLTQEAAKVEGELAMLNRAPLPEDRFSVNDPDVPWYFRQYYPGRTVILDVDRSVHRDCGYSGWVQLDSGDIYVVDYSNDDAPRAYIKSYIVNRSDIIFFPEGDLPWLHPSWQPYVGMTYSMASRQFKSNLEKQKNRE